MPEKPCLRPPCGLRLDSPNRCLARGDELSDVLNELVDSTLHLVVEYLRPRFELRV